jgi:hypothetical protein
MTQVYSIACGLPFCQSEQGKQTNLSICLRVAAIVLGILAAIAGILIFFNIPGLSQLGTTTGWTLVSIGILLIIVGTSIKCMKKQSDRHIEQASETNVDEKTTLQRDQAENNRSNKPQNNGQFRALKLKNFFLALVKLANSTPEAGCDKNVHDFMMEQRYLARKDINIFNSEGEIIFRSEEPVTFAYTPLLKLKKESVDSKKIKKILKSYVEENQKRSIPKLFIPTAVFPDGGVPHALLLVIETGSSHNIKVTIINSLGSGSYRTSVEMLLEIAREVLPVSKMLENVVCQQQDGWSCGWQMLDNIQLLSQVEDIQGFISDNRLPVRSPAIIRESYDAYRLYVEQGREYWNNAVPKDQANEIVNELVAKGKIKAS